MKQPSLTAATRRPSGKRTRAGRRIPSLAAAGYLLHADRRALLRTAVWLGMSLVSGDILLGGHSDLYFTPSIAWTVAIAAAIGLALGLIQLAAAYQRALAPVLFANPDHSSFSQHPSPASVSPSPRQWRGGRGVRLGRGGGLPRLLPNLVGKDHQGQCTVEGNCPLPPGEAGRLEAGATPRRPLRGAFVSFVSFVVQTRFVSEGTTADASSNEQRHAHAHRHSAPARAPLSWGTRALALLFALPVALGIFCPPVVLGAASIALREANVTMIYAPGNARTHTAAPLHTDLLQLQALAQTAGQSRMGMGGSSAGGGHAILQGQEVNLIGFVYHRPDLPAGTFLLTRFITPHCVAEAQPLAILVRAAPAQAAALKDDTWLRVQGALTGAELNGSAVAELDHIQAERIAPPADPYLIY
jgi:uncharacterized repeat protein (TIGR03943 family)